MLIAISGSQGSGKSTILRQLEQHGYPVIKRKTSRSVLQEWNVTLDEVMHNPELTKRFQEEIIKEKDGDEQLEYGASLSRVQAGHEVEQLWFTERTYADAFVYALIYLGKLNEYSNWINEYFNECMKLSQRYAHVFYLKAGHFTIEHDGVRGSNQHYSSMVDTAMLNVTKQMILPSRLSLIDTPDLNQRTNMILTHASSLMYNN